MEFDFSMLDLVLGNFQDGIYITDHKANTVYLNHSYEQITGLSRAEMLGKNMRALVAGGIISASGTLAVLETGESITIEQSFKTGKRVVITSSPVFEKDGKEIVLVVTVVREITEIYLVRKELQQVQSEKTACEQELVRLKNELATIRSQSGLSWEEHGEELFEMHEECKDLKMESSRLEAYYMKMAFRKYGNIRDAAESLGIDSSTFVRKRQRYAALGLM